MKFRMYDMLHAVDSSTLPEPYGNQELRQSTLGLPLIVIDNVADYFFTNWIGGNTPDISVNNAPPLEEAFFEYKMPYSAYKHLMGGADGLRKMSQEAGVPVGFVHKFAKHLFVGSHMMSVRHKDGFTVAHHVTEAIVDLGPRGPYVGVIAQGFFEFELDEFGTPLHVPRAGAWGYDPETGEELEHATSDMAKLLAPVLLGLCFMHCKNVRIVDDSLPARRCTQFKKHTGRYPIKFKTLKIDPMREIIEREATDNGQVDVKRALHICRGHFKDYREKGLFGKYKDIYWWDAHVRGDIKEGVVVKDYEIGPSLG